MTQVDITDDTAGRLTDEGEVTMATAMARRLERQAARYRRSLEQTEGEKVTLAALVKEAVTAGMTEVEASRRAGVTRTTVRAWLGK